MVPGMFQVLEVIKVVIIFYKNDQIWVNNIKIFILVHLSGSKQGISTTPFDFHRCHTLNAIMYRLFLILLNEKLPLKCNKKEMCEQILYKDG